MASLTHHFFTSRWLILQDTLGHIILKNTSSFRNSLRGLQWISAEIHWEVLKI